jgi:hypothetical protein
MMISVFCEKSQIDLPLWRTLMTSQAARTPVLLFLPPRHLAVVSAGIAQLVEQLICNSKSALRSVQTLRSVFSELTKGKLVRMVLRRIAWFCSKNSQTVEETVKSLGVSFSRFFTHWPAPAWNCSWKSQSGIYLCIRVLSGRVVEFASGKSHTEVVSLALSRLLSAARAATVPPVPLDWLPPCEHVP